jgi:hypothetical protein
MGASLDKSSSMISFLSEAKIINELSKGVAGMKTYVYPTILQVHLTHSLPYY